MAKQNVVTAPLVLAKNERGQVEYHYQGSVLPSYVKGDELKALVDSGMVGTQDDLAEELASQAQSASTTVASEKAPAKS